MALYTFDMANVDNFYTSGSKRVSPSARTTTGRYHPYMGHGTGNGDSSYMHPFSYPMADRYPQTFVPSETGFFPTTAWNTAGIGTLLSNAVLFQDKAQCGGLQQHMYALRCLQDAAGNDHGTASGRKDLDHPFYWRRRSAPAEGMTRTREKYRVVYTEKQRLGLEKEYEQNKFITSQRKAELSKELALSDRQIKIWFQNRRAKERRDNRKSSDAESSSPPKVEENENKPKESSQRFMTSQYSSCRFPAYQASPEPEYSTGQCLYQPCSSTTGSQSGTTNTSGDLPESSLELPISPSQWNTAHIDGFVPQLNVSPLTVNIDFGFGPRL